MLYTIRRICEDDYGCEERPEAQPDLVLTELEDDIGKRTWVRMADESLRRAGLDEGSCLTAEEAERLRYR